MDRYNKQVQQEVNANIKKLITRLNKANEELRIEKRKAAFSHILALDLEYGHREI